MSSDCYIMHQYASHNKSSCIWIIGPSEYSIIENKTDDLILKYYFRIVAKASGSSLIWIE